MADTSQSEQTPPTEPQTNGVSDGMDDDERNKMRPADIDADMKEMERRKRVEMIMNSRLFREELERIIETQLKDGNGPAGLLQQLSDMMGLHGTRLQGGNVFRGSNCVIPINDIRGVESMGYAKGEKILRCKLAAVYRLMDLCGWSQGVYNSITARLNQDQEHFLINPFGMLYHEITASSLVKIDMQGSIVEPGTTNFTVNVPGFMLHSAIHAARPDIKCIIHVHTPAVLAVSSFKCGLLPICQEAVVIGEVSNHPYLGGSFDPEEREKIARNLGPVNKVMILSNHGAVCCGETIEEAFYNVYNTVLACETQVKVMPAGVENLVMISDEARKQAYEAARRPPDTLERMVTSSDIPPTALKKEKQWRLGSTEFESLMRMLDNAGFRTGYIYRHPLVKGDPPRPRNDVEVPPAVSSLGYILEEEEMYKQGQWKKYMDGRKTHDRTRWLNSPNVYQKVEILETGTPDPKKITKWVDANAEEWVAEGSPTHSSTPVKIESALQFVPKNTDPKEFKKLQQQIKDNRRADKITSGPQSHILEGVSWEEAKKLQDANISATGDQVILVGAASKGIIQRGFQHNALVYKTPYAKNPFDTITDEELEEYKKVVERKQRGESFDEDQTESEPLSSSLQNSRPTNEDSMPATKSPLMSPTSAASETEEESRDEPRVLRIETKQVPRPSQAEVVLSDAESDLPDPNVERSLSLRLPAKVADSSEVPNEFKRSWSLGPNKQNTKDICGWNYKETGNKKRTAMYDFKNAVKSVTAHYSIIAQRMRPVLVATAFTNFINEDLQIRITGSHVCSNTAVDNNTSLVSSPRAICNTRKLPLNYSNTSSDNAQCNHRSVRLCVTNKCDCPMLINCCSQPNPEKLFSLCMEELKTRFISKTDEEREFRLGDGEENHCCTFCSDNADLSSSSVSLRDYNQQYSSCESLNSFFIEGDISSNVSDDSLDETSIDENFEEIDEVEFTEVIKVNTNLSCNMPSQELCVFNPKHYILCYSTSDSDEMDEGLEVGYVDTSEVTNTVNNSSFRTQQISKLNHSCSKDCENLIVPVCSSVGSFKNSISGPICDCHSYLKNNEALNEGQKVLQEMPENSLFLNTSVENNRTIFNKSIPTNKRAETKSEKCYFERSYNKKGCDLPCNVKYVDHPPSEQFIQANEAINELAEIDTYFWDTKYKFALISVETEYVSKDNDDYSCDKCIVLTVPKGIVKKHLYPDSGASPFLSPEKQNLKNHENQRNRLVCSSKNKTLKQIHRFSNLPPEHKIPGMKLQSELPDIDTYFFSNKYCFKISADLDSNDQLAVTEFSPLWKLEVQNGIIDSNSKQSSSVLLDSYVEKFDQIIENICSNFL